MGVCRFSRLHLESWKMMKLSNLPRRGLQAMTWGLLACLTGFAAPRAANAQTTRTPVPATGLSTGSSVLTATPDVHFDQKVNTQVPVDLAFHDETGRNVMLRDYINGKQPVIVMMPFFKCAGACTTELSGLTTALNDVKYKAGDDFQVIVVSINPKEGPELAQAKKITYMQTLKQKDAGKGFHFLTGTHDSIRALADAIGFRYVENLDTEQFAHATGFVTLSPTGKAYRYFYGSDYNPRDVKLALTEAGQNKIGNVVDQFMVLCYHYDPTTGKYGFLVWRASQVLGIATVLLLGTSIGLMLRWEKRHMIMPDDAAPTTGGDA